MVRMRGVQPIGSPPLSQRRDQANAPSGHRGRGAVNDTGRVEERMPPPGVGGGIRSLVRLQGIRDVQAQPALACSQAHGSTTEPLMWTSKWRWHAVELPVLPTRPMSWPASTDWPTDTWRLP